MSEANQTATPTDARQASMSRVQTQETILAKLTQEAAPEPPPNEKTESELKQEGEAKPKKNPAERFHDLVARRKEAEDKAKDAEARADAAERKAQELEAKLKTHSAQAKPIESNPRPQREQFVTEDEYVDAVTDWKADQRIAKREEEQALARQEAARQEIFAKWEERQNKAMATIPDYAEVVGKSEAQVPDYVTAAIVKSQFGSEVLYYLCLHPEEAKAFRNLDEIDGIKRFRDLERDLAEIEKDAAKPAKPAEPAKPQRSKAPEPIEPVKSTPSSSAASGSDYEEYKRRRQAEKGK